MNDKTSSQVLREYAESVTASPTKRFLLLVALHAFVCVGTVLALVLAPFIAPRWFWARMRAGFSRVGYTMKRRSFSP